MRIETAILGALLFLISGCTTQAGIKPPSKILTDKTYYDTQASIGECPSVKKDKQGPEIAITAAVAASVVAMGVSKIGEAIKAAGSAETQTALARRNVELKTSDGLGPCLLIIRGWFSKNSSDSDSDPEKNFVVNATSKFPAKDQASIKKFWGLGLKIAATPDFYFQGKINPSTGNKAYAIAPMEVTLDKPISTNTLRPSGNRHVIVAVALNENGSTSDLSKGGATMNLGLIKAGELLEFPQNSCFSTTPPLSSMEEKEGKCPPPDHLVSVIRSPFESNWFNVVVADQVKPMNLQALVSETRSASKFLQFAGAVFGDSSKNITEEIQQALIPSIGKQADLVEFTADEAKLKAYETALSKAYTELSACIDTPSNTSKRIAARIAVRELFVAARTASKKIDRLNPESISIGGKTSSECKAQRDLIN